MKITITPWKPQQGLPILLEVPWMIGQDFVPKNEIDAIARMFLVAPITEVRWQVGHVDANRINLIEHDGNGHYVRLPA